VLRIDEASAQPDARLAKLIDEFSGIVTAKTFPCIFSTFPYATGEIYFARVVSGADPVGEVLRELVELCRIIDDSPNAVGVVFVDDERSRSLDDDFALAGKIVTRVMQANERSGANGSPSEPRDPSWSLALGGTALFVNFSSPNHRSRRSRNVGSAFTVIAQARASFDRLNRSSQRARAEIRARLTSYDRVAPHPALGTYGDAANREAWQYFLGDTTAVYDPTGGCPADG
jgi:uncharacterized protein